jgi:hypothetical protein
MDNMREILRRSEICAAAEVWYHEKGSLLRDALSTRSRKGLYTKALLVRFSYDSVHIFMSLWLSPLLQNLCIDASYKVHTALNEMTTMKDEFGGKQS